MRNLLGPLAAWALLLPGATLAQTNAPSFEPIIVPSIRPTGPPAILVPQGSPLERDRPPVRIPTAPGLPAPAPIANEFDPNQTVPVRSTAIIGATAFPPGELSPLTAGLVGTATPVSRIEQARLAILSKYRAAGYLLTTVSAAVDPSGALRIGVTEGYISEVKLDGDIGPAGVQVLRFLNRLTEERPVRILTLERFLLLANDVPGVTVKSVLRPSATDAAAVTLVAQVSRKAVDGLLTADNRAFKLTGPEQFLAVGSFNSFTQFGERTELSVLHSFNNTQTFGQVATEFFIGGSGLKLRVYGGIGVTNPSDFLRALGYDGQTRVFGGQLSYPVIRTREQTLIVNASLDAIESDIRTDNGPNTPQIRTSYDSLRVLRAGVDYALQDTWLGGDRTGVNNVVVRLSHGLSGLGANHGTDTPVGRASSQLEFTKFNGEVSRTQTLFHPWEDASVALYGLVAGQFSNNIIPPAEKFFLGGLRYNRGFFAGEVTGDSALTATLELQLNTALTVPVFGRSIPVNAQFYVFRDWGETWENQTPNESNRRLRSAGLGLRTQVTPYLGFEVEGVTRATRHPQGAGMIPLKADAIYWRVVSRF